MITLVRVTGKLDLTVMFLFLLLALPCKAAFTQDEEGISSLSELNFNMSESTFLKDIPWSQNDPFVHPNFELKQAVIEEHPEDEDDVEIIIEPEPPELGLSAILYSSDSSSAIINGRIVKEGSVVWGQKIIKINAEDIKVEFNGKEYEIKMKEYTISADDEGNDE